MSYFTYTVSCEAREAPAQRRWLDEECKDLKDDLEKKCHDYVLCVGYLEEPLVVTYGAPKLLHPRLVLLSAPFDSRTEIPRIFASGTIAWRKGFAFQAREFDNRRAALAADSVEAFEALCFRHGYETYVVAQLRTQWQLARRQRLQAELDAADAAFALNARHPFFPFLRAFFEDALSRGGGRYPALIFVGETMIGKSYFFRHLLLPEAQIEYHANMLEFSRLEGQPRKVLRVLDDIDWADVAPAQLKAIMNRNLASVNVKYGYEFLFPLIPVLLMNAEDYAVFRARFADIWTFVANNSVVYPPQDGPAVRGETEQLYTRVPLQAQTFLFEEWFGPLPETHNVLRALCAGRAPRTRYIEFPAARKVRALPNPRLEINRIRAAWDEHVLARRADILAGRSPERNRSPVRQRTRLLRGTTDETFNYESGDDETSETIEAQDSFSI